METLCHTGGHFCIAGSVSGCLPEADASARFQVSAYDSFSVHDVSGRFLVTDTSCRFPVDVSPDACFPMASVFKFHQALAVCDRLKRSGVSLDTGVYVEKADLAENTWSPLRDEYPCGGRFTYGELLAYTLQQSD